MNITPISQKRIYQEIIEQIINLIRRGELEIGDRLPSERDLAEMFDVSRQSVREALRVMEVIGLVETRQGGGSYVTDINIAKFLNMIAPVFLAKKGFEYELLELRFMLEVKAAELAAGAPVQKGLSPIEESITKMRSAVADGQPDAGVAADIAFHRAIFEMSGNWVLSKAAEFVVSILEVSVSYGRRVIIGNRDDAELLTQQHERISEAIRDRDPAAARKRMEDHLEFVLEAYRRYDDASS
ncbi:MAG: FadR family transcriptional regulator [Spirochaetaceae bacterium]|nr:MAG: FadR family transcriptional regulator [Spirochaetaceae bacterium]